MTTAFDPVRILEVLVRHGVEFVVVGGFAGELYDVPTVRTQDVDVAPRRTEANLVRLSAALEELEARVRTAAVPGGLPFSHDAASLARAAMWNLTTSAGDFDIAFEPAGTSGYDELAPRAVVVALGGGRLAVASLEDVVRSKEAAGRMKDARTLPALRAELARATAEELGARVERVIERRRRSP